LAAEGATPFLDNPAPLLESTFDLDRAPSA